MAKCAGKVKVFTKRKTTIVLLGALLCHAAAANAAVTVDFPVFHLAQQWIQVLRLDPVRLPDGRLMNADDRVAVETILLEAAGDGFNSMVAVGEAIRNRCSLFGKNTREVCLQPKQFSGWNDSVRAQSFLKDHRAYYSRAWLAWKLSGSTSLTAGATDYHAREILPYWASAYTPSASIGSHIFYIRQARRIRG